MQGEKGFSIWVNHTRKNKDKILIGTEYVCSNEGFCRQCNEDKERTGLERAETRVGCKTMIGLKKVVLEKLVLQLIQNLRIPSIFIPIPHGAQDEWSLN